MAIKQMEMFTVICDRCGVDANEDADYSCWGGSEIAREMADNDDWKFIDGKDYCFSCVEFDEDELDGWKPKDGKPGE